jgi:predicted DNA-binding transcriptional regulator YafY
MPLQQARRALPASLVQLEPHQDGVLLRSSIDDLDMLARLLAGLGCDLVVLQPTELREAFHRLASRLAQV